MEAKIVRRNPVFVKSRDEFIVTLNPHQREKRVAIPVVLEVYENKKGHRQQLISLAFSGVAGDDFKNAILTALSSRLRRGPNVETKIDIICKAA